MQELIYSLKIPHDPALRAEIADALDLDPKQLSERIRLSTLAPLSNRGYTADMDAELLLIRELGVVVGVSGAATPRSLVPWQNIAYLSPED